MADQIQIRGLKFIAKHGVLDFEKERAQPFGVDANLYVDLRPSGLSDELSDSVSYSEAAAIIERVVTTEQYELIERVAGRISEELLKMNGVAEVDVTVKKLHPPIPMNIDYAAVTIHRP